jgi:hypothetical protein
MQEVPVKVQVTLARFGRVAFVLAAVGIGFASGSAHALGEEKGQQLQPMGARADRLAGLERAFWTCDYLAMKVGDEAGPNCGAAIENLKNERFGGDFEKLLQWWRQNRLAQHQRITEELANAPSP